MTAALVACLVLLAAADPCRVCPDSTGQLVHVRLDTHAWHGKQGYVIVALTSGLPGTDGPWTTVRIRHWKNDGYRATEFKTGGGRASDLLVYIGQDSAECTELGNVEKYGSEPPRKYFYSHEVGNFAWRIGPEIGVPFFGDSVCFDLDLPLPPPARASFQDQVYVQVHDVHNESAFPTADPFGADAICAFTARPLGGGDWAVETFAPARLAHPGGGGPATVNVVFPDSAASRKR